MHCVNDEPETPATVQAIDREETPGSIDRRKWSTDIPDPTIDCQCTHRHTHVSNLEALSVKEFDETY